MKIKCLLLDDDANVLEILKESLESQTQIHVQTLDDPRKVQAILKDALQKNEPFDVLVTDYEMPHSNGIDVIRECRNNDKLDSLVIILMTGDPHSCSAQETLSPKSGTQGANDYITKPFNPLVLLRKIQALQDLAKEKDQGLVPIRSCTLFKDQAVPFDVFIQNYGQFRPLIKNGDIMTTKHLGLLKESEVKRLFIRSNHEESYQCYLEQNISFFIKKNILPIEDRAAVISDYSQKILQDCYQDVSNINSEKLQTISSTILEFMGQAGNAGILKMIESRKDEEIYRHCVHVAALCLLFVKKLNELRQIKDTPKEFTKFFEGLFQEGSSSHYLLIESALLHDIGRTLKSVKKSDGRYDHVIAGSMLLSSISRLNSKIGEIVAQHEEYCDGTGGPKNLKKPEISSFAKVIAVANNFDNYSVQEGLNPQQAMNKLYENRAKFQPEVLSVFAMALKD